MKYPTTRFVFDRKNTATKQKAALIQVEILMNGRKKYVSTGVKVYKDQWSEKSHIVNCTDMYGRNERIESVKSQIDSYIQKLMREDMPFDWDAFTRFLNNTSPNGETFLGYISRRLEERNDIKASSKKSQRKILTSLESFGRIVTFSDLTKANIADYYDWLLGHEHTRYGEDGKETKYRISQQTAWSYMKTLRTYIHDAMRHERIDRDPSLGIKVSKGTSQQIKWLTEEEVEMIENAKMPTGSLARVRDLFIFSCYSGLAYSDLMDFNPEKLEKDGDDMYLCGHRVKTGEEYIVLILPKAKEILEKYDYRLPRYSNQQYNHRLKEVAKAAGVDKPLSSHFGRHSSAMLFLNNGVRIETVAKIL